MAVTFAAAGAVLVLLVVHAIAQRILPDQTNIAGASRAVLALLSGAIAYETIRFHQRRARSGD